MSRCFVEDLLETKIAKGEKSRSSSQETVISKFIGLITVGIKAGFENLKISSEEI